MQRSFGYRQRPRRRSRRGGRRFSSPRSAGILITMLLVVFGGWVIFKGIAFVFSGEKTSNESAELHIIKGRVKAQLSDSEEWIPTLSEQAFLEGESIRTENNTKASLEIFGANTIFLDENTELHLQELTSRSSGRKEVHITLETGQIWVKVSNDDFSSDQDSVFSVRAKHLKINTQGSAFNLQASSIQDTIQLLKGGAQVEVLDPSGEEDPLSITLGVGQKLVGNAETYSKVEQNLDVIEIIDNAFMESEWNLNNYEQFYPQDAAGIKRRIELNAAKERVSSAAPETEGTVTLQAPEILTPEDQARFGADTESIAIEGSVDENTFQVSVNGYTLTKYVPGAKKWQYFASTKFGTLLPGENKYQVIATDREGNVSPPAEITIFYEGESPPNEGEGIQPITAENIDDFTAPVVTSPAIFQISPDEIYQTSASVVTFSGTVDPKTNAVEVNGFRLKKFTPGDTEFSYIANANYGNMKEGENVYTITAFGPDGKTAQTSIKIFYSPIKINR